MNIERLYTLLKLERLGKEEIQLFVEQLGFGESEETARKILDTGAILGMVFEYSTLREIVDISEEELLDCLDELILQHFIF